MTIKDFERLMTEVSKQKQNIAWKKDLGVSSDKLKEHKNSAFEHIKRVKEEILTNYKEKLSIQASEIELSYRNNMQKEIDPQKELLNFMKKQNTFKAMGVKDLKAYYDEFSQTPRAELYQKYDKDTLTLAISALRERGDNQTADIMLETVANSNLDQPWKNDESYNKLSKQIQTIEQEMNLPAITVDDYETGDSQIMERLDISMMD